MTSDNCPSRTQEFSVNEIISNINRNAKNPFIVTKSGRESILNQLNFFFVRVISLVIRRCKGNKRTRIQSSDVHSISSILCLSQVETVSSRNINYGKRRKLNILVSNQKAFTFINYNWLRANGASYSKNVFAQEDTVFTSEILNEKRLFEDISDQLLGIINSISREALCGNSYLVQQYFDSITDHRIKIKIIPFLSRIIYTFSLQHCRSIPVLKSILSLAKCILEDSSIDLQYHAHQVIPALMSIVLSKRIGEYVKLEKVIRLQEEASKVLSTLIKSLMKNYTQIIPHLVSFISKSLELNNANAIGVSTFGLLAIVDNMGEKFIRLVLPTIGEYITLFIASLVRLKIKDRIGEHRVRKIKSVILKKLNSILVRVEHDSEDARYLHILISVPFPEEKLSHIDN